MDSPTDCVKSLLYHINPYYDGAMETPERVVKSWKELYNGYGKTVQETLGTPFDGKGHDEIVVVRGIEFSSMCEHHMLPFIGTAAVGYIPRQKLVGLSKMARLVDMYARRLQLQERITTQVTEALTTHIQPMGAACVLKAVHCCMGCRGVRQPTAETITSSMTGVFRSDSSARAELLKLIG